jgi:hypothetical protein
MTAQDATARNRRGISITRGVIDKTWIALGLTSHQDVSQG